MAPVSIDPAAAIPDADLLEQQLGVTTPLSAARPFDALPGDLLSADAADLFEQGYAVPGGDDDYPHLRDPWLGGDV